MKKLDQARVRDSVPDYWGIETIGAHQVALYVMAGGGFLGRFAAEQPADFYIDDRVGRLPYSRDEITQATATLATIAEAHGLNPHDLPKMPTFHNFGIL